MLVKFLYILTFTLFSCVGDGVYPESKIKVSRSDEGVVSTSHPLATKAGVDILRIGGNAVDAAVSAAFTLSVVEPSMSGLGGRAQILIYSPINGFYGIDATTSAPSDYDYKNAPKKRYGYPSIGIPGMVKGLTSALKNHGKLPLNRVMKYPIELAEEGHIVIKGEADRQASVNAQLREFKGTARHFLNEDSSSIKAGKIFIQRDLSKVLKAISSKGPDVFYKGWVAKKIVEDNQANGGVLSMKALEEYKVNDSHIVKGSYRGFDLTALWMPSFGAITIEALQILELLKFNLSVKNEWAEAIYHSIDAAYLDRRKQFSLEDAKTFTSKKWAKKRASGIENNLSSIDWKLLPDSFTALHGHTTHLTVVDKHGMIAVLTQTVGTTMGSKVVTPGLGFVHAQTLGGYLGEVKAGQRAASHISPIIVSKGGEPVLALGAAGGSRIPSSIVAVISRIIDHKLSLEAAVAMPRIHPTQNGIDIELIETIALQKDMFYSLSDSNYFKEKGYSPNFRKEAGSFGRVYGAMKDSGGWVAVSDPDWQGSAGSPD